MTLADVMSGAVNVGTTFPGLYFVEKFGRRKCEYSPNIYQFNMHLSLFLFIPPRVLETNDTPGLMIGAGWMFMCFLVFASCGQFALKNPNGSNNSSIGYVMIIFACLFIAAFASTWG